MAQNSSRTQVNHGRRRGHQPGSGLYTNGLDADNDNADRSASVFRDNWEEDVDLGYSPIPLYPSGAIVAGVNRSKSPCQPEWSRWCERVMTGEEIKRALNYRPDAEIGVCGGFEGVIAVDIDTLDIELQNAIIEVIPKAPLRIGNPAKAGLLMFRWAGEGRAPSSQFKGKDDKVIVEFLGYGRQFVIAPSMWPGKFDKDTGDCLIEPRPYRMKDGGPLPPVWELPELNETHVEAVEKAVEPYRKKRDYQSGEGFTASTRDPSNPPSGLERKRYVAYAEAGIRREAEALSLLKGGRNTALFEAGCKLGWSVHHKFILRSDFEAKMESACHENGYIREHGRPAFLATLESGLYASKNDPLRELQDKEPYHFTDLGNARRLADHHGRDLRYVSEWGTWLVWDERGGRWREDNDFAVERLAKDTIEAMHSEALALTDDSARGALRKFALQSENATNIRHMLELAKSEKGIPVSATKLDADPNLLGVSNGVIDLRTGDFRKGRREDYITKSCAVAYELGATCAEFEKFVCKITEGDDDLVAFLQRYCGYLLTGSVAEEVVAIFWGTGKNGKSTFRETIYKLMGDYACAAGVELMLSKKEGGGPTPEVARLKGINSLRSTKHKKMLNCEKRSSKS